MSLLERKDVMVGVIDVASDEVETPEDVADTIGRALRFVPKDRLIACTNCGMAPMDREVAARKLHTLTAGAAIAQQRYAPDIIVSFSYDETTAVAGKSGVSYASSVNRRGDHGSFSPTDVHISLMARGPHFKPGLRDPLPSANVDIAPTLGRILGFSMPDAQGRVLEEALEGGPALTEYAVLNKTYWSSRQTGLRMKLPTDVDGQSVDPKLTTYSVELRTKILTRGGATYTYFDQARAVRE